MPQLPDRFADRFAPSVDEELLPPSTGGLRKFVVRTTVIPPTEKVEINKDGPEVLLQHASNNDNLLAVLPAEADKEHDWACILPLQQPVTEKGEAYAGMNAPFVEQWHSFDDLTANLLAPNMRFVFEHLENDDAAIGYNYSQDPLIRVVDDKEVPKFKPNSWDHFHMHWLRGVHHIGEVVGPADTVAIQAGPRTMDVRPHRYLREMLAHTVEATFQQAYANNPESLHHFLVNEHKTVPFSSEGGLLFVLPQEEGNDKQLGTAMKAIHEGYLSAHEDIWRLFTANYDDVRGSGWHKSYDLRSSEDIEARIAGFTGDETLQKGLKRYFDSLRPEAEVSNSMNWLYKGPSYSLAAYKHESDYVVSLLPHLMHPTNWLAALGMFEARQSAEGDFAVQREKAKTYLRNLGARASSLQVWVN